MQFGGGGGGVLSHFCSDGHRKQPHLLHHASPHTLRQKTQNCALLLLALSMGGHALQLV